MMANRKDVEALTPVGPDNTAHFVVPSKQRKIIPIVIPRVESRSITDASLVQPERTSPQSLTAICQTRNEQTSTSQMPNTSKEMSTLSTQHHPARLQVDEKQTQPDTVQNNTTVDVLDIHSKNYVPLWLRAVNESNANLQPCPAFPIMDFAYHISTLVGPAFVQLVSSVVLPPLVGTEVSNQELLPHSYASFWLEHLQNEFASQNVQLQSLALYGQRLQPLHGRDDMFSLHVPGIRENSPRIDLGDVVHIRPLLPRQSYTDAQAQMWMNYGRHHGYFCPGFSGLLYDPQVWEIDRAKQTIVLRIEGFNYSTKCNVIFLLQESKLEPVCRAVQCNPNDNLWLRKMLFPVNDDGVLQTTLSKAYFDIPWIDDLNWEQKKAVHSVTTSDFGHLPYLISGPPGTGKTKTLVEIALQLLSKPAHILICAPSNAAADTLALRLSTQLKPNELFRLNGWTRTFREVPDRLLLYTHANEFSFSLPPVEQLLSFRIVVTTCQDADLLCRARLTNVALSQLFNGVQRLTAPSTVPHPLHWTALLLDEAAQATEPDIMIPLSVVMPPGRDQYPHFVAAGDQHQLGPKLASKSGLATSLFQRLFDRKVYADHPLSRRTGIRSVTSKMLPMMRPAFTNLVRNYRSHSAILAVPSSLFYGDSLIPDRKTSDAVVSWPGWPSQHQWPVLFQQNNSEDVYESIIAGDGSGAGALYNPGEADVAVQLALSLLEHASEGPAVLEQKEIMVMSPFRAQVSQLRRTFRHKKLFDVNIGPMEAFQGLESRVVIICTTRTRLGVGSQAKAHHVVIDKIRSLGMIDEPQRFNVAVTRAQEGLIVIGNAHCLTSTNDNSWLNFIAFCKRNDCYWTPEAFEWPDLGGPHTQGRLERALIYHAQGKEQAERSTSEASAGNQSRTSLKLMGRRPDMDEEMWQFKELAQLHDSENVDLVLESPWNSGWANADYYDAAESCHDIQPDRYDRDLKREFYEGCVTH